MLNFNSSSLHCRLFIITESEDNYVRALANKSPKLISFKKGLTSSHLKIWREIVIKTKQNIKI